MEFNFYHKTDIFNRFSLHIYVLRAYFILSLDVFILENVIFYTVNPLYKWEPASFTQTFNIHCRRPETKEYTLHLNSTILLLSHKRKK